MDNPVSISDHLLNDLREAVRDTLASTNPLSLTSPMPAQSVLVEQSALLKLRKVFVQLEQVDCKQLCPIQR